MAERLRTMSSKEIDRVAIIGRVLAGALSEATVVARHAATLRDEPGGAVELAQSADEVGMVGLCDDRNSGHLSCLRLELGDARFNVGPVRRLWGELKILLIGFDCLPVVVMILE